MQNKLVNTDESINIDELEKSRILHSQPSSLILLLIEVHREDILEEKTNVFIKSPQSKDFQRSQVM